MNQDPGHPVAVVAFPGRQIDRLREPILETRHVAQEDDLAGKCAFQPLRIALGVPLKYVMQRYPRIGRPDRVVDEARAGFRAEASGNLPGQRRHGRATVAYGLAEAAHDTVTIDPEDYESQRVPANQRHGGAQHVARPTLLIDPLSEHDPGDATCRGQPLEQAHVLTGNDVVVAALRQQHIDTDDGGLRRSHRGEKTAEMAVPESQRLGECASRRILNSDHDDRARSRPRKDLRQQAQLDVKKHQRRTLAHPGHTKNHRECDHRDKTRSEDAAAHDAGSVRLHRALMCGR